MTKHFRNTQLCMRTCVHVQFPFPVMDWHLIQAVPLPSARCPLGQIPGPPYNSALDKWSEKRWMDGYYCHIRGDEHTVPCCNLASKLDLGLGDLA